MDMDFAVGGPLVRRLRLVFGFCPSTHAFARCFLQTPPRGGSRPCTLLALHLHQVGQKTFTSKLLSMPSTPPGSLSESLGLFFITQDLERGVRETCARESP